jgi:hypothetical protein
LSGKSNRWGNAGVEGRGVTSRILGLLGGSELMDRKWSPQNRSRTFFSKNSSYIVYVLGIIRMFQTFHPLMALLGIYPRKIIPPKVKIYKHKTICIAA